MRATPWPFALLAILTFSVSGQQLPGPNGAVAGTVLCSDTQTPCRFAAVTIETAPPKDNSVQPAAVQPRSYAANTDINGAFRIDHVLPGDYYILPRLAGYLSSYDSAANQFRDQGKEKPPQNVLDSALTRITVVAGQTTTVSLSLARGASLDGTVLYDDGAPGIGLPIHLYRKDSDGNWGEYRNLSGDSSLAPLGLGLQTDDRGRYYEPGLPPGAYKVEVTLPVAMFASKAITGRAELNVTLTKGSALQVFNGGTYRLENAPSIELQQGEDRSGIDLTIPTDGLRTISGVVAASVSQQAITSGTVRLLDPETKSVLRETALTADGSFVFQYVVDGAYLLQIEPSGPYAGTTGRLQVTGDITDLSYSLANAAH